MKNHIVTIPVKHNIARGGVYVMKRKFLFLQALVLCLLLITVTAYAIGNWGVNLDSASYKSSNPFYPKYEGQCTWYAWGRAHEKFGTNVPCRGNANTWASSASAANWPVDSTPKADSIAVWTSGSPGHVAYVEAVENGQLYITESNRVPLTYSEGVIRLSDGYYTGTFNDSRSYSYGLPNYYIHVASTVTFNANGGSGGPGSMKKAAGLVPSIPASIPTRSGYEFVKWNSSSDGSGQYSLNPGESWGGDFDITFYAIWKQTGVSLDVNGYLDNGTVDGGTLQDYGTVDVYINGVLKANDVNDFYSADGYWPVGSTYEIKDIKATAGHTYLGVESGALTGTLNSNTSVKLKFSTTYKITYDANGGTGAPAAQTKIYGQALTLSSNLPAQDGFDFLGWNTNRNATNALYKAGASYTKNEAAKLYAIWKLKKYTIDFDANGGSEVDSITVNHGSSIGSLPNTSRAGFLFRGWFTTRTGGRQFTSDEAVTQDYTLYAHWAEPTTLTLPALLTDIEDEAFEGINTNIVIVPETVSTIGSKAFANCKNLISVRILGKDTIFESDTFENSPNVVIYCYSNSRAQRLAAADGIEYHLIGVASDWVLAGNVPDGAEITARKWTYTLREYTQSSSSSYSGWTKYDSKRTSWTGWSAWQDSEITSSSTREVQTRTVITGYDMISYCVSGPQGRSYQPSPTYTVRLQHGPYRWTKAEFDSARVFSAGSYFDYADNVAGYVLDATGYCKWDGSETGGYVPMFIQETIYGKQWSYRDAVYTYYYYRDVDGESATNPAGQDNVSNVQEWVQYIY